MDLFKVLESEEEGTSSPELEDAKMLWMLDTGYLEQQKKTRSQENITEMHIREQNGWKLEIQSNKPATWFPGTFKFDPSISRTPRQDYDFGVVPKIDPTAGTAHLILDVKANVAAAKARMLKARQQANLARQQQENAERQRRMEENMRAYGTFQQQSNGNFDPRQHRQWPPQMLPPGMNMMHHGDQSRQMPNGYGQQWNGDFQSRMDREYLHQQHGFQSGMGMDRGYPHQQNSFQPGMDRGYSHQQNGFQSGMDKGYPHQQHGYQSGMDREYPHQQQQNEFQGGMDREYSHHQNGNFQTQIPRDFQPGQIPTTRRLPVFEQLVPQENQIGYPSSHLEESRNEEPRAGPPGFIPLQPQQEQMIGNNTKYPFMPIALITQDPCPPKGYVPVYAIPPIHPVQPYEGRMGNNLYQNVQNTKNVFGPMFPKPEVPIIPEPEVRMTFEPQVPWMPRPQVPFVPEPQVPMMFKPTIELRPYRTPNTESMNPYQQPEEMSKKISTRDDPIAPGNSCEQIQPKPAPKQSKVNGRPSPALKSPLMKPLKSSSPWSCAYCEFRRLPRSKCNSHTLYKKKSNEVLCRELRRCVCIYCGATGGKAHRDYDCPKNPRLAAEAEAERLLALNQGNQNQEVNTNQENSGEEKKASGSSNA